MSRCTRFGVIAVSLALLHHPAKAAETPMALEATDLSYAGNFTANWTGGAGCDFLLDVSADPWFGSFLPGYQDLNVGPTTSSAVYVPEPGRYYYRVRAVDEQGASEYSGTIAVNGLVASLRNYGASFNPGPAPAPLFVGDSATFRVDVLFNGNGAQASPELRLDTDADLEDSSIPGAWGWSSMEMRDGMEQVLVAQVTSPQFTTPTVLYWGLRLSFARMEPFTSYGSDYWLVQSSPWWTGAETRGTNSQLMLQVSALPEPVGASATQSPTHPSSQIDLAWPLAIEGRYFTILVVRSADDQFTPPQQGTVYAAGDPLGDDVVLSADAWSTAFEDTGLASGTTYHYRFYTVNQGFYSAGASAVATTEGEVIPDPADAAAAADVAEPQTRINVSWTDTSGGAGQVIVVRSLDALFTAPAAGTYYDAGQALGDDVVAYRGGGAGFADTGRSPDTTYYYRLHTEVGGRYSAGVDVSAATQPLPPPDMRVLGTNGAVIANGDSSPSPADGTDFGEVPRPGGQADRSFVITNEGAGVLNLGAVLLGGAHAADFSLLPGRSVGWAQATGAAEWPARYEPELLSYSNQLWLLGGGRQSNYTNDVWKSSDGVHWTLVTAQAAWAPRMMHAALVFQGRMWVIGGYSTADQRMNDVWSSEDGVNWTRATAAAGWSPRAAPATAELDGKLWVFGGDADPVTSDVWSSPDGVTWTRATASAAWSARTLHCGVAFNNKLWVIGGGISGDLKGDVWSSSDGATWTEVGGVTPRARYAGGSVVHQGRLWVMGGVLTGGGRAHDVWSSADGLNWVEEGEAAWGARDSFSLVSHQGSLWLAGGYDGDYKGDVWFLGASSVAPGGAAQLDLRFAPMASGGRTATVSIANGDAARNPYVFTVRGTGGAVAEPSVSWTANSASVPENGAASISLVLSHAADATVEVQVAAGNVAGLGIDFSLSATQVVFSSAGSASRSLTITGLPDALLEGDESATLVLANARGATLGATASLTLTVVDAGCPPATPPTVTHPGTKTFTVGTPGNFTVTASDGGCPVVQLVATGAPAGAVFTSQPDGADRVGTFSWTPGADQQGTHLVRFIATDSDALQGSAVMQLFVRGSGEETNASGVPASQTNWSVAITNIFIGSGNTITVAWNAVEGIAYDVYRSYNTFGGGMGWQKVTGAEADSQVESVQTGAGSTQQFYQIVPAGFSPTSNGVWGLIKPVIKPGAFTMLSPPLQSDRAFAGAFGASLAAVLHGDDDGVTKPNGDEVFILESNGAWVNLYLDSHGVWRDEVGAVATQVLRTGQGVLVQRGAVSGTAPQPSFVGAVGNDGGSATTLSTGWNIIGLSEGKPVPLSTAFNDLPGGGSLNANWDEAEADLLVIMAPDGSWRRYQRMGDNQWYDLRTLTPATISLTPGQAYYFLRQPAGGDLTVRY